MREILFFAITVFALFQFTKATLKPVIKEVPVEVIKEVPKIVYKEKVVIKKIPVKRKEVVVYRKPKYITKQEYIKRGMNAYQRGWYDEMRGIQDNHRECQNYDNCMSYERGQRNARRLR